MASIPHQLFDKASEYGLVCLTSERGDHCIKPALNPCDWYLTNQKGTWVLVVKDVPQIRFNYEDAVKFIDRFAKSKILSY